MSLGFIVFLLLWSTNFVLFNCRRSNWVKSKYKWYVVITLFVVGVVLYLTYKSTVYDVNFLFACITAPAFYSLIDYGFERLSFEIHHRDFYLWIKGSSDLWNKEIQFKASDRIFSVLLLFISIGAPLLPVSLVYAIKTLMHH